ncbi:MAG: hypothetical protein U5M53_01170, partial [Rhodoferax sp.]|nr:hypothetical protein [Rhodoferax sp.]
MSLVSCARIATHQHRAGMPQRIPLVASAQRKRDKRAAMTAVKYSRSRACGASFISRSRHKAAAYWRGAQRSSHRRPFCQLSSAACACPTCNLPSVTLVVHAPGECLERGSDPAFSFLIA